MNAIRKLRSPWVIVTFLLASYVTSHFAASDYNPGAVRFVSGPITAQWNHRAFEHAWMVDLYRPMTYIESKVRGKTVTSWYDGPGYLYYSDPTPMPITRNRD